MIRAYRGVVSSNVASADIDPSVQVIGVVEAGERPAIWPNGEVRQGVDLIRFGLQTNLEDHS